MKSRKRIVVLGIVLLLMLAIPATALATKNVYKARLTTGAELHDVVGSNAVGSFLLGRTPTSFRFTMIVQNLSGPVTGAHLHGPATEAQNGPIVISGSFGYRYCLYDDRCHHHADFW